MKYENFTFVSFQLSISVLLLSPNLWFNPFFGIRFSVQVGRYLKKETRNLSVHIVQTITNGSHEPGLMSLLKEEIKTLCMPEYPSTLTHVKVSEAFRRFSTIRHTWVRVWNVSGNLRRLRKVMASFHILLFHFVGCSGNLSQIFGVFLATCPSLMYPLEIKVTYFPKHLTVNTKAYASLIEIHSHNCWYFLFFKRSRHKFWIFPCKFESARETLTFSFSLGRTQTKSIFLHAMTEPKICHLPYLLFFCLQSNHLSFSNEQPRQDVEDYSSTGAFSNYYRGEASWWWKTG